MEIRPIRPDEVRLALPLFAGYQEFYEHLDHVDEANLAFFSRFCEPSDDGLLLGAWDDGDLVGFATLYWSFSSASAFDVAIMNDLFVAERARGKGFARALIEASAEAAKAHGCRQLEWLTAPDNTTAQRVYDKTGAERVEWVGYELPLT